MIAHFVNRHGLITGGLFAFVICLDQKKRLPLKLFYSAVFFITYWCSNYIFGLGFILNFKMIEPNLIAAHQHISVCELKTKNGETIMKPTGTGHNSAYIECASGFTRTPRKKHFFKSGPFRLTWDINGD